MHLLRIICCIASLLVLVSCSVSKQQPVYSGTIQKRQKTASETIIYHPPPKKLELNKRFSSHFSTSPSVKIAILLPLSGTYKDLGKQLFNAAQLALFALNEPTISLMPIDTKGTSFGAEEAAKEAVEKEVQLVLGPVFSSSARVVAPILGEAGIEFVTFSNDESLADSGALLIGLSPQQQVQRVVEYAIRQGIEDYVTVVPNNALGAAAAKVLRETVNEYEGTSVLKTEIFLLNKRGQGRRVQRYVNNAIHAAIYTKPQKDYNQTLEMYNLEPIKYPRGLFIDGSVDHLLEMVRYIEKNQDYNQQHIQLLGTMRMADPKLIGHPAFEGALIASLSPDRKGYFEKMFVDAFGYQPTKIASLAFDGIALTATLSKLSNGKDFSRTAITTSRGFVGIDGIFRIKDNGLSERGLAIMKIQNGTLLELDPAPDSFFDVQQNDK